MLFHLVFTTKETTFSSRSVKLSEPRTKYNARKKIKRRLCDPHSGHDDPGGRAEHSTPCIGFALLSHHFTRSILRSARLRFRDFSKRLLSDFFKRYPRTSQDMSNTEQHRATIRRSFEAPLTCCYPPSLFFFYFLLFNGIDSSDKGRPCSARNVRVVDKATPASFILFPPKILSFLARKRRSLRAIDPDVRSLPSTRGAPCSWSSISPRT